MGMSATSLKTFEQIKGIQPAATYGDPWSNEEGS